MDAAVLYAYGTPQFGTFDDPVKLTGTEIVQVSAAAISNFDLSFASGQHYLRPTQRSKSLAIFGYASYHASLDKIATTYRQITELAGQGRLIVPVERMPLRQVEQAWERQRSGTRQRLVLMP